MSLYAVALRFPLTGTKGPSLNHENSPRPLFIHQTLQLVLCIGAGNVFVALAKHRLVCRTARWWSVIPHSRERISTAPESNGGELYSIPTRWVGLTNSKSTSLCQSTILHSTKVDLFCARNKYSKHSLGQLCDTIVPKLIQPLAPKKLFCAMWLTQQIRTFSLKCW